MNTVENRANQEIAYLPYWNTKISSDQDQIRSNTLKKKKRKKERKRNEMKKEQF